jgi:hypothetical protein
MNVNTISSLISVYIGFNRLRTIVQWQTVVNMKMKYQVP